MESNPSLSLFRLLDLKLTSLGVRWNFNGQTDAEALSANQVTDTDSRVTAQPMRKQEENYPNLHKIEININEKLLRLFNSIHEVMDIL